MITLKRSLLCFVLCLAASNQIFAQSEAANSPNSSPQVRFIETAKTSTFEKELNDAAKEGFRLTWLAKGVYSGRVRGILLRQPESEANALPLRYEYKVLATARIATMRKELDQAAAEGYEFRGITTENNELPFSSKESVAVLERPVNETKRRFEYRLVTDKKKHEELQALSAEGFTPIEVFVTDKSSIEATFSFSLSTEHLNFILSRSVDKSGVKTDGRDYQVVWKADNKKMEAEVNKLAKEGFQLDLVAVHPLVLMSRAKQSQPQKYEYKVLTEDRKNPLGAQVINAGLQGYKFRGAPFVGAIIGGGPYSPIGLNCVLEREIGGSAPLTQIDYLVQGSFKEKSPGQELGEALAAGFSFGELLGVNSPVIVLHRKTQLQVESIARQQ
ncbi:MAG: hypothetical protein ACKVZH_25465 [Blastocatellia bacterium]